MVAPAAMQAEVMRVRPQVTARGRVLAPPCTLPMIASPRTSFAADSPRSIPVTAYEGVSGRRDVLRSTYLHNEYVTGEPHHVVGGIHITSSSKFVERCAHFERRELSCMMLDNDKDLLVIVPVVLDRFSRLPESSGGMDGFHSTDFRTSYSLARPSSYRTE